MFWPSILNHGDDLKGLGTEVFMELYPRLKLHPRRKLILDNSSLNHAEYMQRKAVRSCALLSSRERVTASVPDVLSAESSGTLSTS